jgi:hypothetical protein
MLVRSTKCVGCDHNKWREQMMELVALAMLGVFAFAATMSVLAVLD